MLKNEGTIGELVFIMGHIIHFIYGISSVAIIGLWVFYNNVDRSATDGGTIRILTDTSNQLSIIPGK